MSEKRKKCLKALDCLYLVVEADVADDVNQKVKDYIAELEDKISGKVIK